MVMFGRSLLREYIGISQMYGVVKLKVIGGNGMYNPAGYHRVFVVQSFCLALDACLESTIPLLILRTAVGSFVRVVTSTGAVGDLRKYCRTSSAI
jgi:hypothetical protein